MKVGVIGGGSWGTTLANLIAEGGKQVDLWVREREVCAQINHQRINQSFLPGVKLSENLRAFNELEIVVKDKNLILMVVPSHVFREVLVALRPFLKPEALILSATKGIENETLMLMSEIIKELLPDFPEDQFACLAGPSFATEVARHYPTAVTIACKDQARAKALQEFLYREYFRIYISEDVVGVQLGGALKNVIAIAAGACDALNFGHNARAALITRGLAEISRLGIAMGANPLTFSGLAGMGDLVLTCTGDLSRNRTVGFEIGRGKGIEEILGTMTMVAEGVRTAKSAYALSRRHGVEMPITEQVYQILYEDKDPNLAVRDLMTRRLKPELYQ